MADIRMYCTERYKIMSTSFLRTVQKRRVEHDSSPTITQQSVCRHSHPSRLRNGSGTEGDSGATFVFDEVEQGRELIVGAYKNT
jgi:hypothetical protein